MILWMKSYSIRLIEQGRHENYFDGMRRFDCIQVSERIYGVFYVYPHPQFFHDFSFQPIKEIFSKMDMPTRKLVLVRQKLFRSSSFCQEDFFHAIKRVVNQSASGDNLLAARGGFTIVTNHRNHQTLCTLYLYSNAYSHPGFHFPVFRQSASNASAHDLPLSSTSRASCGALCETNATCFPA